MHFTCRILIQLETENCKFQSRTKAEMKECLMLTEKCINQKLHETFEQDSFDEITRLFVPRDRCL